VTQPKLKMLFNEQAFLAAIDRDGDVEVGAGLPLPRKINTHYRAKPIPPRGFDWSAIFDDSADDDCLVGYGATEEEAIQDLEAQVQS